MNKRRADNGIPKYQQIATDIAYKNCKWNLSGGSENLCKIRHRESVQCFFGDSAQSNVHSCGLGCGDD